MSGGRTDRGRSLAGRRVVLVGASSGIGRAAVGRFAAQGASLALLARSTDELEAAGAEARAAGVAAHPLTVDVADRDALRGAITGAAAVLGGLDVLVLNAGAAAYGPFQRVAAEDFDQTFRVDFEAAVDAIRAALPHLRASRGVIVATVSVLGRAPFPLLSPYVAAKHALRGFLGSLRIELQEDRSGVRVAMVHPGPVDTPLWERLLSATGRLPPHPPLSASPEQVADALVSAAISPRAEVGVGPGGSLFPLGWAVARPVAERAMAFGARWAQQAGPPAAEPDILRGPSGSAS